MPQLPQDLQNLGAKPVPELPPDLQELGGKPISDKFQFTPAGKPDLKNKPGDAWFSGYQEPIQKAKDTLTKKTNESSLIPEWLKGPYASFLRGGMNVAETGLDIASDPMTLATGLLGIIGKIGKSGVESVLSSELPGVLPIKQPPKLLGPAPIIGGPSNATGVTLQGNVAPDAAAHVAGMGIRPIPKTIEELELIKAIPEGHNFNDILRTDAGRFWTKEQNARYRSPLDLGGTQDGFPHQLPSARTYSNKGEPAVANEMSLPAGKSKSNVGQLKITSGPEKGAISSEVITSGTPNISNNVIKDEAFKFKPGSSSQANAMLGVEADEAAAGLGTRIWNTPRSLKASLDMSAPLRQGKGLVLRKEFYTSMNDMVRAWGSENAYKALQNSIIEDPLYGLASESKLGLMDLKSVVSNREEHIISDLAEKIPGIGRGVRASNRAYTGYLNKLRFDTFKSLAEDYKSAGIDLSTDLVKARELADYINTATGRGSLKFGSKIDLTPNTNLLTNALFAPKLISSRLKIMASPITYANADPILRKEAMKTLLGLTGASLTELGLMKAAGAKVGIDPTSADFWKGKFGNVRMDPNAGFQSYFVLAARFITGQKKSSTTGNEYELGSKFGLPTRNSTIGDFVVNKENPIPNFVTGLVGAMHGNMLKPSSIHFGSDKRPYSVPEEMMKTVMPMMLEDIYEVAKENPKLLPATIPYGFFGGSTQAYK